MEKNYDKELSQATTFTEHQYTNSAGPNNGQGVSNDLGNNGGPAKQPSVSGVQSINRTIDGGADKRSSSVEDMRMPFQRRPKRKNMGEVIDSIFTNMERDIREKMHCLCLQATSPCDSWRHLVNISELRMLAELIASDLSQYEEMFAYATDEITDTGRTLRQFEKDYYDRLCKHHQANRKV